nr:hypothetical protein [Tanacetum cinerariifolium]
MLQGIPTASYDDPSASTFSYSPNETLTPRRLTKRAIRIAQSKALSPDADEPVSLSRDDRHGEAFPIVSSLDARQDRENIAKTSAMSHESSPRVPFLDADEGSMQHRLHELMELCTSLQRQPSQMAKKIKDQDIEISGLQARVKSLEDKEKRHEEPIQKDAPIIGGIIDIWEELGADKSTEKGSNDTKDMVNVLSSMDAANILSSGGAAFSTASVSPADVFPTAGVPTVSAIFTTASVATPYTRRSREKKLQEQIDAQVAREMEEEFARENQRLSKQVSRDSEISRIRVEEELKLMIEGLDRSNKDIAKHLSEYKQAEADLSVGKKIELIIWKHMQDFVPMSSKKESERVKRPGIKLDQGNSKRVKISHTSRSEPSQEHQFKGSKGVSEKELKGMMQLVPLEEVYIEALQVELKRLFELDSKDQLWTYHQAFMHDPLDWKLYDTCGVHRVSTKRNQEIFMLVEKDYPLRKGLATVMISNKLQESLLGLILYRTPWPIKRVLRRGRKVEVGFDNFGGRVEEVRNYGGKDRRGSSIFERGGGSLAICLMESKDGLGGGGLVVVGGRSSSTSKRAWGDARGVKNKSLIGSMLMAKGEECLDGWVGAGGGEVKGGGVEFGVTKSLLGEIFEENTGESGGEELRVDGGAFASRWVVIGDYKEGISDVG